MRRSSLAVLGLVIAPAAVLSLLLQRHGHGWGDDFALYVRQAQSLIDGNIGQVLADNRVNVQSAARPGFSPYSYPWGFPVLLAPFVRLFGLNFDRLKWVEVAFLCGFLGFWFAIVRRRMAPWLAVGTVAVTGYSMTYLSYTNSVLSELPYMCLAAATLWYIDRVVGDPGTGEEAPAERVPVRWTQMSRRQLITVGLLMMAVFNTRREGLALVPAVMALQLIDWWPTRRERPDVRTLALPHLTFLASVIIGQLLLPSALAPEYNGAGLGQTWRKMRTTFQDSFVQQLGFDSLSATARIAFGAVVLVGIGVQWRRNRSLDVALVIFAAGSLVIVGMIPADAGRYTMAITPIAIHFAVQAAAAIPKSKGLIAGLMIAGLLAANISDIPGPLHDSASARRKGEVMAGPMEPSTQEMFAAVRKYTHHDDMVGFFKGRALTLFTERRAVQSKDLDLIIERADWFVMGRSPGVGIPNLTNLEAASAGLTEVWSNNQWTLFQVPTRP
jgi:hypothetical protein